MKTSILLGTLTLSLLAGWWCKGDERRPRLQSRALLSDGSYFEGAPAELSEESVTVIRADVFHDQCPVCERFNPTAVSIVGPGWCVSTLLKASSYTDSAGNWHFTDPNTTTCEHRCSAGHEFQVIYSGVEELVLRPDGSRIR